MTMEKRQARMRALQERHHPHCLLCSAQNNRGLQVPFRACEDGSVAATLAILAELQGYRGVAHGGIVTSLLDAAMVNCLFTSTTQSDLCHPRHVLCRGNQCLASDGRQASGRCQLGVQPD